LNKTIAIIGCGWLGLPLAKTLINKGYQIKGSTTSHDKISLLKNEQIDAHIIQLNENGIEGDIKSFLNTASILIINVPPRLRGNNKENYVTKMHLLHAEIKKSDIKKIIFVSSTSVYGAAEGEVSETTTPTPNTESGKQLIASEKIFRDDIELETTIIRFGGLINEERHPVTMLSKKESLSNGNIPINLIHRNDCIRIIETVLNEGWWNSIINGVYPYHPKKETYYSREAEKRGIRKPNYSSSNHEKGKIINSDFLIKSKQFKFLTDIRN